MSISVPGSVAADELVMLVRNIRYFSKHFAIPTVAKSLSKQCLVTSPYAGGVLQDHAKKFSASNAAPYHLLSPHIKIAAPALGTENVLYWRLWAISLCLQENGVKICVLPRARLPEGVQLPTDYPFSWWGTVQTVVLFGFGILES